MLGFARSSWLKASGFSRRAGARSTRRACQQALQFGFCFGAHAVGESIRALPVLGAERGQAHMQVGPVLFQAAQQPLSSGDSFFQCDHGEPIVAELVGNLGRGKPRLYSATAVAGRKLQAGCRVRGSFRETFSGNGELAKAGRSVREARRSLVAARVFRFASGRSAIFQADTVSSAEPRRSGYRRGRFRRPRRLRLSVRVKC